MKKQTVCNITFLAILVISILVIIFRGTECLFHSDDATAVLVAREQILQKKLILDDWNHGTFLWTIGLQTFVIPFLIFIKDWILCRELAVILQTVLFLIVVYKMLKCLEVRERLFCLALCIIPISEEILEHSFFQATYLTSQLFYYLIITLSLYLYKRTEHWKKACIYGGFCILAIVICCHSNLASISVTAVPIIAAIILYYLIENFILHQKTKPDKKIVILSIVLICGTMVSLLIYLYLCRITGFEFANAGVSDFIGKSGYGLKISEYVDEFLLLYGGVGENPLFSLEGILRILRIFYLIFMCFLVPCYLLRNYKNLESMQKLFLLYSVLTYIILSMVALTTGKCSSRYFIPVYFNNIILFGIFSNQIEEEFLVITKMLQTALAVMAIGCSFFYLTYNYEENTNDIGMWRSGYDIADEGLVKFLEEENIGFIYAPYWHAYANMVLSDGKVQAIAYEDNEPMKIKRWLNSDRWSAPEYYNGRTAVLFLPTVELDNTYWDLSSQYLQYGKWNILVFDQNLLLYEEFCQIKESVGEKAASDKIVIAGNELKYTGNAEQKENSVYLYKEGIQKWNSCDLEAGEYSITIQGENLKNMSVFSYYLDEAGRIMTIDMEEVHKKNSAITYKIKINEARTVELYEKNEIGDVMRIDSIEIGKIQ